MRRSDPFSWITPHWQRRLFWPWSALAILLMIALQMIGRPLITADAPQGIVSFELAGTPAAAAAIVAGWDSTAQVYAGLSLGLDYLFMIAYAGAIGLGCVLLARRLGGALAAVGLLLAWGQWAAALLDAVENLSLIRVLLGDGGFWPALARWCAIPKFALVGAGLLYVLVGGLLALRGREHRPE